MDCMDIPFNDLSLTQLIQLQEDLRRAITSRFARSVALVFSDVVGSTAYFERFGAAAGRGLLQRHLDFLDGVMAPFRGRVVDTAGDGAFCVYPSALMAVTAMMELQEMVARDNLDQVPEHHLTLRIGVHWGSVLTDDEIVTGDAVNLAARIASAAEPGEIRVSDDTFQQLPPAFKFRCRTLPPQALKGIPDPVETHLLEWRDPRLFSQRVRFEETGREVELPPLPVIRFGRLGEYEGQTANDIVLSHPDPNSHRRISRWHFELRRGLDGFRIKRRSRAMTTVDGEPVPMESEVLVRPGARIRVSEVLTVLLLPHEDDSSFLDGQTVWAE